MLPKLKILRLFGVHIDWYRTVDDLNLGFPADVLRPGTSSVEALELSYLELEPGSWLLKRFLSLPRSLKMLKLAHSDIFGSGDVGQLPMLRSLERLTIEKPFLTLGEDPAFGVDIPHIPSIDSYPSWLFIQEAGSLYLEALEEFKAAFFDRHFEQNYLLDRSGDKKRTPELPFITLGLYNLLPTVEKLEIVHYKIGCGDPCECEKYCHSCAWLNGVLKCINWSIDEDSSYARLRVLTVIVEDAVPEGFEWDEEVFQKLRDKGVKLEVVEQHMKTEVKEEDEWKNCFEDRHESDPRHHFDGPSGEYYGLPFKVPEEFRRPP